MIILAGLTLWCTECLSTQMKSQCQSKKRKKVLNKEREAHKAKRGKSGKTSLPINGIGTVALYKKWRCEKIKTDKVLSPVDQRKAVADKDRKTKRQKDKKPRATVKDKMKKRSDSYNCQCWLDKGKCIFRSQGKIRKWLKTVQVEWLIRPKYQRVCLTLTLFGLRES